MMKTSDQQIEDMFGPELAPNGSELEREIQHARQLLDQAYDTASKPDASPQEVKRWIDLSNHWTALSDRHKREQLKADQEMLEAIHVADTREEINQIEQGLLDSYGARGEQYRIMCRVLAPLVVRLKRSYDGRLKMTPAEQADLARVINTYIAQLQKHTESMKSETTRIDQAVIAVLSIAERHLVAQPKIWTAIVQDVRKQLAAPEDAPSGE